MFFSNNLFFIFSMYKKFSITVYHKFTGDNILIILRFTMKPCRTSLINNIDMIMVSLKYTNYFDVVFISMYCDRIFK